MTDLTDLHDDLRSGVRQLCAKYPGEYWQKVDKDHSYPTDFVNSMSEAGYLKALIPEEYGGIGVGITEASIILEEVHRSGGNAAACHAQMYIMGTLLRHGSDEQKAYYLPKIASGELRLQAFGVTEPNAGTDTTNLRTRAVRDGDEYVVNGQKIWISRAEHSDLMILLARTTPIDQVKKKTQGLSVFLIDLKSTIGNGVTIKPIETMINHQTTEIFIDNLRIPADTLIGEEGMGFRYILDGMNAERVLIAAECVGDGYWFVDKATNYANDREVFGRPISQNQGIQFPIAQAYIHLRAADLMRYEAARLYESGQPCGAEANMAKLLAADASWEAANTALQTYGGYAFAREYDIERKFRETRLYQVAPISTNLVLSYVGQHILGMPRSF